MTETIAQNKELSNMLLPELKALATNLGIDGATGMRKADLVSAINAKQSNGAGGGKSRSAKRGAGAPKTTEETSEVVETADTETSDGDGERRGRDRGDRNDRNFQLRASWTSLITTPSFVLPGTCQA